MRVVAAFVLAGCFSTPVRPADPDALVPIDGRVCPTTSDDFEDPTGPACGSWGSQQFTGGGTVMRANGGLLATVANNQEAGCLGIPIDLNNGVWLQITTNVSASDTTRFELRLDTSRSIRVDFSNNNMPTYQGIPGSGAIVGPATAQTYSRDVMKFWRFTRGTSDGLYDHIDFMYSTTGEPGTYLPALQFGVSGPDIASVTPRFVVVGASASLSHSSTLFDNFNKPCVDGE